MATSLHMRIRALLDAALRRTTRNRTRFLRESEPDTRVLDEALALLPHYAEVTQNTTAHALGPAPWLPGTTTLEGALGAKDLPDWEPPFSIAPYYSVVETLGRGGMGVVYRAADPVSNRNVAIKVLRGRLSSAEDRRRFKHEEELLRQLRHPGIVRLLHGGTAALARPGDREKILDERPYFVMEYVRGLSLLRYAEAQNLDSLARIALFAEICTAIDYAHHRGVIHRDLKPDNILVDATGRPKILDFGIARLQAFGPGGFGTAGRFCGTIAYASPEQWQGQDEGLTPASDVYTLGLLLHELLTGALPQRSNGRVALALQSVALPPGATGDTAYFQYALRAIIATALRRAAGTYANAGEIGADLAAVCGAFAPVRTWRTWLGHLASSTRASNPAMSPTHQRLLTARLRRRIGAALDDDHESA